MSGRSGNVFSLVFVLGTAAILTACSHADAVNQAAPQAVAATAPAPAEAPRPMTREQASTDCWMKYDKEARHLSLDQRLPLVEKCTAEKLKAAAR